MNHWSRKTAKSAAAIYSCWLMSSGITPVKYIWDYQNPWWESWSLNQAVQYSEMRNIGFWTLLKWDKPIIVLSMGKNIPCRNTLFWFFSMSVVTQSSFLRSRTLSPWELTVWWDSKTSRQRITHFVFRGSRIEVSFAVNGNENRATFPLRVSLTVFRFSSMFRSLNNFFLFQGYLYTLFYNTHQFGVVCSIIGYIWYLLSIY